MRYLILSDIHSNWEALQAVMAQARDYDRIACCGDVVGYGADPDRVTEWVKDNVANIVRGNHDKACAGLEDLDWFSPMARASAEWTRDHIRQENLEYLRDLAPGPEHIGEFQILHGSPLDEDEYLVSERDVAQIAPYLDAPASFFGHTHLQGIFLCHRNGVKRLNGTVFDSFQLEADSNYLINSGSVGQPRDGDPRAGYAIYEPKSRLVTLFRVEYDVPATQRKILKAGLPEQLAFRLELGL